MTTASQDRSSWQTISPKQVPAWDQRLVDVRSLDEFLSERLDGVECIPLEQLLGTAAQWDRSEPVLLLCKTGMRASEAARQLSLAGFQRVCVVEGGIDACKRAGLDIRTDRGRLPIYRQVLIGAGLVLLTGLGLSFVHPGFIALTWFAASMLVIAGCTGFCPMALILARMPWNAPPSPPAMAAEPGHDRGQGFQIRCCGRS
jgi:rhodanese-related sulfurtransferase